MDKPVSEPTAPAEPSPTLEQIALGGNPAEPVFERMVNEIFEQQAKDAERYRWLRGQFKLASETREWDEFVGENRKGQKVYETKQETWHSFELQDAWRFGETRNDGTTPKLDDMIDAAMKG